MGWIYEKIDSIVGFVVLAVMAGTSRTIMTESSRTFGAYMRTIALAGFVGWCASLLLQDIKLSEGIKGCIVGAVAFVASDILNALLLVVQQLAKDPIGTWARILNAWRGK